MSAIAFDYTGTPVTITIKNVIDPTCYKACDAGTPVQKVEVKYSEIADKPCVKFDYIFEADGSFKKDGDGDIVVLAHQKFKNTDRKVPAYRTFNGKTLKAGESVAFTTSNKDEIVFYEKVAEAFGAITVDGLKYTGGELDLTIAPAAGE